MTLQIQLAEAVGVLERYALKEKFLDQEEFVVIKDFLPPFVLEDILKDLESLRPSIHRNFIPNFKKSGSVSRFDIDQFGEIIPRVYSDPALFDFLNELAGGDLQECPKEDPHAYALYFYTEIGDHIGFHHDNSYYKGRRYTLLLGLIDNSSSELECALYRDNPSRETKMLSLALSPGALVFFNGDRLYHRVTPLAEGELRVALTMEFVTDVHMNRFLRFVSNMKDSIAYFGFKVAFSKGSNNLS